MCHSIYNAIPGVVTWGEVYRCVTINARFNILGSTAWLYNLNFKFKFYFLFSKHNFEYNICERYKCNNIQQGS